MDSRPAPSSSPRRSSRFRLGVGLGALALGLAGASASGCLERGLKPVNPCTRSSVGQRIQVTNVDNVDLLFMIDNSNSMAEEQVKLASELPRLVRVLASGDRDGDGSQDFNPVKSLHVGIVTSDMGGGPHSGIPTCPMGLGDDGLLRDRSRLPAPCMTTYPSGVFDFQRERDDANAFAATVGCVANIGTGGCGFEQQLESPLKALTPINPQAWTAPGYTPPRFVDSSGIPNNAVGNGENPRNAGFLRENSALAIVLVTDEEDCSVQDYSLFVQADPRFSGVPLNLRCNTFGDPGMGYVYPVERYVAGFLGLRRDPGLLIFSGIVGIPPETEAAAQAGDFTAILSNPNMIPRVDAAGTNLEPSCSAGADGAAYPPIRIVQTAAGLASQGAAVSLSSICSSSFQPAIDGIIAKIADALRGACLPRALNAGPDGRVGCDVYELLPAAGPGVTSSCADLAGQGRTFERVEMDTAGRPRELCKVAQVARADVDSRPGWYYDDFTSEVASTCTATPQRIAFTTLSPPATGSEVRLECLQTITPGSTSADLHCDGSEGAEGCRIGQFCSLASPERNCTTGHSRPGGQGAQLACDPVERLCSVPCVNDASCTDAGLLGYICDTRPNRDAAGGVIDDIDPAIVDLPRNICVNPTCN